MGLSQTISSESIQEAIPAAVMQGMAVCCRWQT